jgi:hypothetical protein
MDITSSQVDPSSSTRDHTIRTDALIGHAAPQQNRWTAVRHVRLQRDVVVPLSTGEGGDSAGG